MEWIVDAVDCNPKSLADLAGLRRLCERIVDELQLTVLGEPLWHQFPPPSGITGLYLLSESHLTCHTFPEHELASLNLYCCRHRPDWPWESRLKEMLGARTVYVRRLSRGVE